MLKNNFYTLNGYMKKENNFLTPSMEDYLEMIYRLSLNTGFTRLMNYLMHLMSNHLQLQTWYIN